jgi:hypothetical protein
MHAIRSRLAFLSLIPALFLPAAAQADGAFIFKLGTAQVQDQSQVMGATRELDATSSVAYGAMFEHRFRKNGIGLGVEYAFYRHEYSPPTNPNGTAETRALMFSARKYFLYDKPVRPFIGFGLGVGRTNVENAGVTPYTDEEYTTVFQAVAGVEFRVDNLSFMLEVKRFQHDIEGGGNEYDPTSNAVFAGFGFNW